MFCNYCVYCIYNTSTHTHPHTHTLFCICAHTLTHKLAVIRRPKIRMVSGNLGWSMGLPIQNIPFFNFPMPAGAAYFCPYNLLSECLHVRSQIFTSITFDGITFSLISGSIIFFFRPGRFRFYMRGQKYCCDGVACHDRMFWCSMSDTNKLSPSPRLSVSLHIHNVHGNNHNNNII